MSGNLYLKLTIALTELISGGSPPPGGSWLLATGFWDDTGVWDDASNWID